MKALQGPVSGFRLQTSGQLSGHSIQTDEITVQSGLDYPNINYPNEPDIHSIDNNIHSCSVVTLCYYYTNISAAQDTSCSDNAGLDCTYLTRRISAP